MKYLTAEQILLIHSLVLDETGGLHGVRDHASILSVVGSPRQMFGGKDLYLTIFDKAAVYARLIILNHPFLDGNKRTGISVASVFLEDNGYRVQAREGELENFAVYITTKKPEVKEVARWFKKHSKQLKR